MVPFLALTVASIFTSEYGWTLAVIIVVTMAVAKEPCLVAVVVLVIEIDLELLHAWLQEVEVPAFGVRAGGADEFEVGISSTKGVTEEFQAGGEGRIVAAMSLIVVPLLVANTQIVEVEGFGMSHFGANLAPLGVDITIGKLYKVESILDVRLQVLEGNVYLGLVLDLILELASQTAADDRKRLATEVLAKLEELEEAKAIGLVVVGIKTIGEGVLPTVLVDGAILDGTYRVLPLVALLKVGALDDTATWETEYAGLEVAKCLSKILAHAILAPLPGILGEHRDVLEVGSHDWFFLVKATKEDAEGEIIGSYLCGNLCGVLLPFLTLYVNAT